MHPSRSLDDAFATAARPTRRAAVSLTLSITLSLAPGLVACAGESSSTVIAANATPSAEEGAGLRAVIDPDTGELMVPDESSASPRANRRQRAPTGLPEATAADNATMRPGPRGGVLMTPPDYSRSEQHIELDRDGEPGPATHHPSDH